MRYFAFLIAIGVGVGLGLYYGWVVSPVELVDTAPSTLRADFKADYVLMVAEAYSVDPDVQKAARLLGQLGGNPQDTVQSAERFAAQIGYDSRDLALMRALGEALKSWSPVLGEATPQTP